MSTELLRHLSNKIQEEVKVMSEEIAMGKAKDYGDYKHACGMIRGLLMANNIIAETAERYEEIE